MPSEIHSPDRSSIRSIPQLGSVQNRILRVQVGRRRRSACSCAAGSSEVSSDQLRRAKIGAKFSWLQRTPATEPQGSACQPAANDRDSWRRLMETPETHYAHSGEVNIAYQVLGDGPFDLVFVPGSIS